MMMMMFCVGGARFVNPSSTHANLAAIRLSDTKISPSNPNASFTFNPDGTILLTGNNSSFGGGTEGGRYYTPPQAGIGDDLWCFYQVSTGVPPSVGPVDQWQRLNISRAWQWARSSLGGASGSGLLTISRTTDFLNIVSQWPVSWALDKEGNL